MPQGKKTSTRLKPDDVVEQVVPDPNQVPDVIVLIGFLGRSNRAGFWRLYLTSALNEYVEFAEEAVVHSQSLVTDENPLAGTAVWVRRDADLAHTRTVTRQAQLEFLQGDIMAGFMARNISPLSFGGAGVLAVPRDPTILYGSTCLRCYTVVFGSCPTNGGENTCVPATCTLATSCRTQFLCL